MVWNGPIDGDYTDVDFTKQPWANGIATLSHEECLHVLEDTQEIIENYDPATNNNDPISDFYIQARYNEIDWQYAINGETYAVIKGYDPEIHTLGINENGIIESIETVE